MRIIRFSQLLVVAFYISIGLASAQDGEGPRIVHGITFGSFDGGVYESPDLQLYCEFTSPFVADYEISLRKDLAGEDFAVVTLTRHSWALQAQGGSLAGELSGQGFPTHSMELSVAGPQTLQFALSDDQIRALKNPGRLILSRSKEVVPMKITTQILRVLDDCLEVRRQIYLARLKQR